MMKRRMSRQIFALFANEAGARLVEQQQLWLAGQRPGHPDHFLHAVWQRSYRGVAVAVDFKKIDDRLDALPRVHFFGAGATEIEAAHERAGAEPAMPPDQQIFHHGQMREQLRVLKGPPDAEFHHLPQRPPADRFAVERNLAALGAINAVDAIEHGRITRLKAATSATSSDGAAWNETERNASMPPKRSARSVTASLAAGSLIPTTGACGCIGGRYGSRRAERSPR